MRYKEGRYFASLAESPEIEASADSFYEAIEELDKLTDTSTFNVEESVRNDGRKVV